MLGRNNIVLNAATMEQAVQEWFDKRFKPTDGSVYKVDHIAPRSDGGSWSYEVSVVQNTPAQEEPK